MLDSQIGSIAARHRLPARLVIAMIQVESGGDESAWNPEPRYRWFWNVKTNAPFRALTDAEVAGKEPPRDFPALAGDRDQEWWAQQASWGLMQVMGAVARERGFIGKYLPELVRRPELCVHLGCAHLAWLRDRYVDRHGWPGVVRAYNTGTPKVSAAGTQYLRKVKAAGWDGDGGLVRARVSVRRRG